jgi:general L-amino acid transport system ATP-binding protein
MKGFHLEIEFKNVRKSFGDFEVLKDINFLVGKGEKIVICGPSGSGKSTLIRLVNQLEDFNSGEITVFGQVLSEKTKSRFRGEVGMVFQQFNLFPHLTVIENIMLAPVQVKKISKDAARQKALELLKRVQILEQADKYPGFLSGGQQQRVAIARALAMEPKIMLFDEPTSALDPEMISEVLEVMQDLTKTGMTMLCVTHEMGFAKQFADRVVFMEKGQIVETSPPQQFFSQPKTDRAREFLSKLKH